MRHSVISEKLKEFSIINIAAVRHVGFSKIKNDNYRLDLCVVQNFIQIGRLVAGI